MTPVLDTPPRSRAHDDEVAVDPRMGGRARRTRAQRWGRRFVWLLAVVLVVGAIAPRMTTFVLARGEVVHDPSGVPVLEDDERRAAIVLGAGLVGEEPSPLLRERIDGAIELLEAGRVDMLVMSGDNSTEYYDEPTVMRNYAVRQGVPQEQVAPDYAGRRTWDSCVRAREVFGIERAVVVTNAFHVDRAVMTCRAAGVDATGYSVSDGRHALHDRVKWRVRELAASGRAVLDAYVLEPEPAVRGGRIDPWKPCELYGSLAPSVREEVAADFTRFSCAPARAGR